MRDDEGLIHGGGTFAKKVKGPSGDVQLKISGDFVTPTKARGTVARPLYGCGKTDFRFHWQSGF